MSFQKMTNEGSTEKSQEIYETQKTSENNWTNKNQGDEKSPSNGHSNGSLKQRTVTTHRAPKPRKPVKARRKVVPDEVEDGGWGWVCVCAAAFNMGTFRGLAMAFSIVNQAMQIRYQATATATSWVYSLFSMVLFMSAIVISPLCKRLGCRPVGMTGGILYGFGMMLTAYITDIRMAYFTYSLLGGVASCIVHNTVPLIVNQYFARHRAKATAIIYVGNSVATMIFAPLLSYLIEHYGLTTCMIAVGCIALNQTVMSALFRPPDSLRINSKTVNETDVELRPLSCEDTNEQDGDEKWTVQVKPSSTEKSSGDLEKQVMVDSSEEDDFYEEDDTCRTQIREFCSYYCDIDLLRNPTFLTYTVMTFFFAMGTYLVDSTMAGWAKERGLSVREASWVISAACFVEIISRLSSGFVFDSPRIRPIRIYIFGMLVLGNGIVVLLFPLAFNMTTVVVMFMMFRVFAPAIYAQETVILSDISTPKKFYGAIGMCHFARSISTLMGPVFGGMIKDGLGSYDGSFIVSGALCLVGSILYLVVSYMCIYRKGNKLPS